MGTVDHGRRGFLTGKSGKKMRDLPLPWLRESALEELCTRCGDCIEVCPEAIIKPGAGGYPHVTFALSGCTFCGECARACPEDLFDLSLDPPWQLSLHISDQCLTKMQVMCQSCRDACEASAILFRPEIGRVASPALDASLCTGCGACVSSCPANAISLERAEVQGAAP